MDVIAAFKDWLKNDGKIAAYWGKVKAGTATVKMANDYSRYVGGKMSEILQACPLEELVEIRRGLNKAYAESAYYCKNVISAKNSRANVHIKPVEPMVDDRVDNLINKLDESIEGEKDARWLVGAAVVRNICKSAVNDTVKVNIKMQSRAGLKTKIVRKLAPGGCCEWCEGLAGNYDIDDAPADVWAMHKDCDCYIEYTTTKKVERVSFGQGTKYTS